MTRIVEQTYGGARDIAEAISSLADEIRSTNEIGAGSQDASVTLSRMGGELQDALKKFSL